MARAGRVRKVPLSARKVETAAVRFPVPRNRVKTSKRESFVSCGEATTFQNSYSGVQFRSSWELPLLSKQEKGQIFPNGEAEKVPDDWEERFGDDTLPLFWQESKPIQFWAALLGAYKITSVFDCTAGSGALLEACMTQGTIYHGLCASKEHQAWLQAIADRAACGLVSLEGSTLFSDSLALEVKKFFPDVLTSLAPKSDAPEAQLEPDSPGDGGA